MAAGLLSKFKSSDAITLLPKRKKTDNKTAGGKSLIIAGSEGMFGAAVLAATAAARAGAGYVILMTDQRKFSSVQHPDFLVIDSKQKKIKDLVFTAAAIGPGLGVSTHSLRLLKQLLAAKVKNVVVDADALNLCAKNKLYPLPATWVITPHEGELARLLETTSEKIRKNRVEAIKKAQKKLGCTVLLKGSETLVATQNNIFMIQSGNAALAKAGTGDVLTGIITAFLSQGLSSEKAACLGAFVHGYTADQWLKKKKDHLSLMASDLVDMLPESFYEIRTSKRK